MTFDIISNLSGLKVESLIQQGLDTILKRQTEDNTKTGKGSETQVQLRKRSLDRQGKLYELPPSHSVILVAYQIRRKGSHGSIIVTLEHIRLLYQTLNREILTAATKGNLKQAEILWKQQKNINVNIYSHRIKVFRVNQAKILNWIIDLDLQKETSYEKSYSSGTAKAILESLMTNFLDEPNAQKSNLGYLDALIEEDWIEQIKNVACPLHHNSTLNYKLVFRKPPRFAF
jgi:hypothetical protein